MKRINYWYWGAIIGVKSIGAILYLGLMSMGLRLIYPEMGVKLSKIVPFLDEFELSYKWDRAHLAALLILIMSWFLCDLMLKFWVSDELVQTANFETSVSPTTTHGCCYFNGMKRTQSRNGASGN